jgi:outer membrane protein assembly factor BamB
MMRRALIVTILIIMLAICSLSSSAQLADTCWPTYRGNLKRTGLSPYTTDIETPHIKWKFNCENGVESSPAIGADGTIYCGSFTDNFFAINPNGTERWRYTRENVHFRCSPTIDEDGTIYVIGICDLRTMYNPTVGDDDFGYPTLIALYPNGTLKWEFNAGGLSSGILYSPGIASDGSIYQITGGAKMSMEDDGGDGFWAIKSDGTEKWFFPTGDAQYSASAIADDETVYFGCTDGNLYALYPNGTLKWSFINDDGDLSDNCFNAVPSIGPDGIIYAGSKDQNLYALYPNGTMKWNFKMNSTVEATPSIGPDGTIYAGGYAPSDEKYLYALDPDDGSIYWRFETGSGVYGTPAIDANGILYFGSYDSNIYSLNPDGTERWRIKTNGGICMPPSIDSNGTVYVGSWDNYLYAIDGNVPEGEAGDAAVDGEDDNGEGDDTKIPGFEVVLLLVAISIILFFRRRKTY